MRKYIVVGLIAGILAPVTLGAAIHTLAASGDTKCWDEYNTTGTRKYGTLTSAGLAVKDCTPGSGCFWGYDASGKRSRLYTPYKSAPSTCNTTPAPTTTTATTT